MVTDEHDSKAKLSFEIFGITIYILQKYDDQQLSQAVSARNSFAYAVTTSSTTGHPKIVQVPHQSIVPNIIYFRYVF